MTPRLKAGIFVRALIRRAEVAGAQAYVLKKGIEESGAVFLRLERADRMVLVLSQARAGEGDLVWARPLGDWTDGLRASDYLDKQKKFDPDLWIVEIVDAEGRAFVDEKIV